MLAIRADESEGETLYSVPAGGSATMKVARGEDFRLIVSASIHFRVTVTNLDRREWAPVTVMAQAYTQVDLVLPGHSRYEVQCWNRDTTSGIDIHVAVLRGMYGGFR